MNIFDDSARAQAPLSLRALAAALKGHVNGRWINLRGPDHSGQDHSLGIRLDPTEPDGFRVHSLAGDDPAECHAYVKALLSKISAGCSLSIEYEGGAEHATLKARISRGMALWNQAYVRPK